MVGQGALRECLADPEVERVLAVGRSELGQAHQKIREIVHKNLFDFIDIEIELQGYDACFFCLGVSSAGMNEPDYRRVTYNLTLAAARLLANLNPNMTFIYVSGMGTDSTGRGRSMWARVKGQTENALLALPFKAYMFRPGFIQPLHGIRSKTLSYRILYAIVGPIYPILRALFPKYVTTTEEMGKAMLQVVKNGGANRVLESQDIHRLAMMD